MNISRRKVFAFVILVLFALPMIYDGYKFLSTKETECIIENCIEKEDICCADEYGCEKCYNVELTYEEELCEGQRLSSNNIQGKYKFTSNRKYCETEKIYFYQEGENLYVVTPQKYIKNVFVFLGGIVLSIHIYEYLK